MTEIVTEGSGRVEQPGDQADISASFSAVAATRADAVAAVGRTVDAARLDVPGSTVRHRSLNVHDEWRDNQVIGCRASLDIGLLVTDVTQLEAVLSAVLTAEPGNLHGPRWSLREPDAVRREAQRRAVADARDRAEGYADALGGTLGALLRLSEAADHGHPMPAVRMMAEAQDASLPGIDSFGLEPEIVEVTVRCTTAWTFLPG